MENEVPKATTRSGGFPSAKASATEFYSEALTCPVHSDCQAVSGGRHARPAAPLQALSRLWHPGDRVRWRDRIGVFRRDVDDNEHAEIVIADRTYRVRVGDLV